MAQVQTQSIFKEVCPLGEDVESFVPGNGEIWEVTYFQGSGAYLDDTTVSLQWDFYETAGEAQIIAATHGDAEHHSLGAQITGDGTKSLCVVLTNDTDSAHVLGGRFEARRIG